MSKLTTSALSEAVMFHYCSALRKQGTTHGAKYFPLIEETETILIHNKKNSTLKFFILSKSWVLYKNDWEV